MRRCPGAPALHLVLQAVLQSAGPWKAQEAAVPGSLLGRLTAAPISPGLQARGAPRVRRHHRGVLRSPPLSQEEALCPCNAAVPSPGPAA
ncbi:hypothetical protein NDU88_002724 [Pleurodeles waltl]|uniref:Uncharacterized protein n=1 Tax=Pleurodeles waltl TaxID=8319 RepID=A0AAV7TLG5_PLEWA|nr:hypothetical protein NDU88_002724 [Pleurodeles waltl]